MKKIILALNAIVLIFCSCSKPLPNASITGNTFGDYVPYGMIIVGAIMLLLLSIDYIKNRVAYSDKSKNPAEKWFWLGVLGAILVVMGFVIKA